MSMASSSISILMALILAFTPVAVAGQPGQQADLITAFCETAADTAMLYVPYCTEAEAANRAAFEEGVKALVEKGLNPGKALILDADLAALGVPKTTAALIPAAADNRVALIVADEKSGEPAFQLELSPEQAWVKANGQALTLKYADLLDLPLINVGVSTFSVNQLIQLAANFSSSQNPFAAVMPSEEEMGALLRLIQQGVNEVIMPAVRVSKLDGATVMHVQLDTVTLVHRMNAFVTKTLEAGDDIGKVLAYANRLLPLFGIRQQLTADTLRSGWQRVSAAVKGMSVISLSADIRSSNRAVTVSGSLYAMGMAVPFAWNLLMNGSALAFSGYVYTPTFTLEVNNGVYNGTALTADAVIETSSRYRTGSRATLKIAASENGVTIDGFSEGTPIHLACTLRPDLTVSIEVPETRLSVWMDGSKPRAQADWYMMASSGPSYSEDTYAFGRESGKIWAEVKEGSVLTSVTAAQVCPSATEMDYVVTVTQGYVDGYSRETHTVTLKSVLDGDSCVATLYADDRAAGTCTLSAADAPAYTPLTDAECTPIDRNFVTRMQ